MNSNYVLSNDDADIHVCIAWGEDKYGIPVARHIDIIEVVTENESLMPWDMENDELNRWLAIAWSLLEEKYYD